MFVRKLAKASEEQVSSPTVISAYISDKVKYGGGGKLVVSDFAQFIQTERPGIKASPLQMFGVCGNSMKHTEKIKTRYRWFEKLTDRKI
jgi:hypothetical protein